MSQATEVVILRGPGALARAVGWQDDAGRPTFVLDLAADTFVAWGCMRRLLGTLAESCDPARILACASRVRGRLSVCLPALATAASEGERIERARNAAVARHPFSDPVGSEPLADAWSELLAGLFEDTGLCLVVPDASLVDPESWTVFPMLLRRLPATTLVLGDLVDHGARSRLQERVAHIGRMRLARLEAMRHASVSTVTCEPAGESPPSVAGRAPWAGLDSSDDHEATRLAAQPRLDRGDAELVAAAMHRAFDAQSFAAVARLAEPLLASSDLLPDRSAIRLRAAIAAETLTLMEPRLELADPWVKEIEASYREALPGLVDPGDRCHACYRLALYAVASGDLPAAAAFASAAWEASLELEAELRPLFQGYAANVVALVSFKSGRLDVAVQQSKATLAIFDAGRGNPAVPEPELDIARFKVMNNLARLTAGQGKDDEACAWVARSEETRSAMTWNRPFFTWISHSVYLDALRPRAEHLEALLEHALSDWDEHAAAKLAYNAASLRFMTGDAARALELYELTHAIWAVHLAHTPGDLGLVDVLGTRINCLVAAHRAGSVERGLHWLGQARELAERLGQSGMRIELGAMEGQLEAMRGNRAAAARLAAEVTAALAGMEGDPVGCAALHREVGNIMLALGERAAASERFRRALALATSRTEARFRPIDRLSAIAGLLEAGHDVDVPLASLVELALASIEDENVWGELPRIVNGLARRMPASERGSAPLLGLCRFASQRPDCADAVATLRG